MEGSKSGSYFSYFAVAGMLLLFLMESSEFFAKKLVTDLALDSNKDPRVRLNFNITLMDLRCEYAVVDVVSVLGTEQNVSSHITKWGVDAEGVRKRYAGRNKDQKDIKMFDSSVTSTIEELYSDGEDAVSLDEETLEYALRDQQYLFVDFYASWCSHCRALAPTWETLAELMSDVAEDLVEQHDHEYSEEEYEHAKKVEMPVMIAKIDCVLHKQVCMKQGILGYPTLRLFVDGERWKGGDYRGDRTVVAFADWLQQVEDAHKTDTENSSAKNVQLAHMAAKDRLDSEDEGSDEEHEWAEKVKRHKQRLHHSWVDAEHPGCNIAGHLLLDRVPGNFHIQARSPHHDLVPHMTNVSHVVHHLSIGEPVAERLIEQEKVILPEDVKRKLKPMNGNAYVTKELHEAYHHYLKVITTNVDGLKFGKRDLRAYQILQSSQLSFYRNDIIPEAKFVFDLSPVAVSYRTTSRRWYDYFTSILAIIGGTFTVVGLLESTIHATVARKRRY
jgi:thiol-disulfide isomerase/thioredoxin